MSKRETHTFAAAAGQVLVQILFLTVIATAAIGALVGMGISALESSRRGASSELAFQIAEAGVEYYRWHLAHDPDDYQDGTGKPGPYYRDFTDKEGNVIGQFALTITPPPQGSTVVVITSTATTTADPAVRRTVRATLAIPSLAQFATAANAFMRFGPGTEVFGAIHSNGGIRFDGIAHNIVTSAVDQMNDPDHSGNNEFGVHTHKDPPPATTVNDNFRPLEAPPNPVQNRNDVFLAGRQFPVPAVDFAGFTADLAQIKADAQASGRYWGPSGSRGYHLVLNTNDTFTLYRVNSTTAPPTGCINVLGQQQWGTWSIQSQTLLGVYAFPANGLIFIEDDLWVDGQINTARLTIAAGRFPDNPALRKNIIVNSNLKYTNYDGQDAIALIAQNNFNVGLQSADDLRIDAALIAQNGRAGRHYYRGPWGGSQRCSPYHVRQKITLYGMIATNQRYGFAYTDGTGYQTRIIIYDANLLYGPPPSFPLTSDQYETISWEEVR